MAADWDALARALRGLHKALMERARREYENGHGAVANPGHLLQLLSTDPYFAWLRTLSELMVDIDIARDAESPEKDGLESAVRPAIEHVLSSPGSANPTPFAEQYWRLVQDDPHVAMAHAGVKQALAGWPGATQAGAAALLSDRTRLAEQARQRKR